jgi:opine dehydrogenase
MIKNVCIIGAGSSGLAMAVHLIKEGYVVKIWNRNISRISTIIKTGKIIASGVIKGYFSVKLITTEIQEAIKDCKWILINIPANAHREVIEKLSRYIKGDQIIVLNPGRTLGSLEAKSILKRHNKDNDILETQTVFHTSRVSENGIVHIYFIKQSVKCSCLPSKNSNRILELKTMFNQLHPVSGALDTGLNNVGAILHPLPMLLNIGWMEYSKVQFKYYHHGITPTIAKILEMLDKERLTLAKKLGIETYSIVKWFMDVYGVKKKNLYSCIRGTKAYKNIDAPKSIKHRYIYEDVPTGIVPMLSLAKISNIKLPTMELVLELSNRLCNENFYISGRSLENLGISKNVSIIDIKKYMEDCKSEDIWCFDR